MLVAAFFVLSIIWTPTPTPEPTPPAPVEFDFENTDTPTVEEPAAEETPEPLGEPTINIENPTFETVEQLLNTLTVETEHTETPYDRDKFKHWTKNDTHGSKCDVRDYVLIMEAQTPPDIIDSECKIFGGQWYSTYDNTVVDDSSKLDIDHMVPLKEAWDSGAWAWTNKTRETFANDVEWEPSLTAVSASSNRSKSADDPADWLPTNNNHTCDYTWEWVTVKIRWQLTVDEKEHQTLNETLNRCIQNGYNLPDTQIPPAEITLQ